MQTPEVIGIVLGHSRPYECLKNCLVSKTWLEGMSYAKVRFERGDAKYIHIALKRSYHEKHLVYEYPLLTFLQRMVVRDDTLSFTRHPLEYEV